MLNLNLLLLAAAKKQNINSDDSGATLKLHVAACAVSFLWSLFFPRSAPHREKNDSRGK
jgi:hypothetical protein